MRDSLGQWFHKTDEVQRDLWMHLSYDAPEYGITPGIEKSVSVRIRTWSRGCRVLRWLMDLVFLKTALLTLFVAIDPPGLAPIFLTLTSHMTREERGHTALHAVMIAFVILAAAALGGGALLHMLGVGFPAFRIAGGLLLFYIGFEMVFERREPRKSNSAETAVAHDHPKSIAAFPLAIPLMAGPGAITATILQANAAGGSWLNVIGLLGILVAVIGSCYVVFLLAVRIDRLLGTTGRVVLSRLLGVLLAAMAVQTVGDGVLAFPSMLKAG